jgi:predicted ATPase
MARISTVELTNYKSIETCRVDLGPLMLLVGRNGAGKSNFLDALRFTKEALHTNLEFAMRERGGIKEVRRRSRKHRPPNFSIGLDVELPSETAHYEFRVKAVKDGQFAVAEESCEIRRAGSTLARFEVREGNTTWSIDGAPPASAPDRLFLVAASGQPAFRPLYDHLVQMAFHNLNPEAMKRPQRPEAGETLAYDGHNVASVVKRLEGLEGQPLERVASFLRAIGVPVHSIAHRQIGSYETVRFDQAHGDIAWTFDASGMSDGTIRAFGILISILSAGSKDAGPTLVAVEEPETALHPAAAGALVDALMEGAESTQVLLSCHSPDLLDHSELTPEMILVVVNEEGFTRIGRLSETKQQLLRDHLSTGGELMRLDQLTIDPADLARQGIRQGQLFP